MPASEAQIRSNQANSLRSTGPKSELGKSRSRLNATKHGLAGESSDVAAGFSAEFEERRARWAAEQQPVGEAANFAMDRVVAATFRIERCERTIDEIMTDAGKRAALAWDEDHAVEAASIAGRLGRDPVLASRQLQTSLAGVVLLIEAWMGLVEALHADVDWTEEQARIALDLLGIAPDLRSGRTPIDPPRGDDPIPFRLALASDEIERLEALRDEALAPLDLLDRRRAMAGHSALLSKPAKLALRYERDAWNRYNRAMKELKGASASPIPTPASPPPPPVDKTQVAPIVEPPRITQPATIAPTPSPVDDTGRLAAMGSARTRQPEPRMAVGATAQSIVTERTQIAGELTHGPVPCGAH